MINIGIIGCGYWGPNLLRNFTGLLDCSVKIVIDIDYARRNYVKEKYPQIATSSQDKDLFSDEIDAVVIATPAQTHYSLAREALENKKHVLVEKPLAMSVKEARELIHLAKKNKLILMVGHTFEYNKAVQELKRQIKKDIIGTPYYLYSQRLNFGIVRRDINALWNLAPHDISIFIYLLEAMPISVSSCGYDFIQKGIEDVVFMSLEFPGHIAAHIHVSWLDPSKVRKMTIVGSKKMMIYDDMANEKIKIFDKGIRRENIKDSLGAFDDFKK
ncbi:MAG TPA: Gfo/Idh/MocA family oxidoreductase, partial [Candidatus Omnitrophota bacterium]|nr:Gfo/Idh/MocA family oxidoreductase [Candidatus Omnitrophota bacterium]